VGDVHLEGKTLIQMAHTVGYVNPEKALGYIRRALELMSPVREPRLELCAQHALAEFLTAAGRPQDALCVLDALRQLTPVLPPLVARAGGRVRARLRAGARTAEDHDALRFLFWGLLAADGCGSYASVASRAASQAVTVSTSHARQALKA
jgi:hypothetical protein